MAIDVLQIAQEYAKARGKDTIRFAGEKNGWKYYHVFLWETRNHKLGLRQYIKINRFGKIVRIEPLKEIMWAINQECILNNL